MFFLYIVTCLQVLVLFLACSLYVVIIKALFDQEFVKEFTKERENDEDHKRNSLFSLSYLAMSFDSFLFHKSLGVFLMQTQPRAKSLQNELRLFKVFRIVEMQLKSNQTC